MLPLSGKRLPATADEFATALRDGLSENGVHANVIAAGAWPKLDSLQIELARASGSRRLPKLEAEESLTIAQVRIAGHPVLIEGVLAEVDVQFSGLKAGLAAETSDNWQVVPLGAEAGKAVVEVERARLEEALHQVISLQAGKHGATIKSTKLELSAPTPRSVAFAVTCTAKMFIASTTLTIRGLAEVDEDLNATLSRLSVAGEGMMGTMAQGFIQPHIDQWNGRVVPLASYVAGGLKLRDVRVTVGTTLRVEATLG